MGGQVCSTDTEMKSAISRGSCFRSLEGGGPIAEADHLRGSLPFSVHLFSIEAPEDCGWEAWCACVALGSTALAFGTVPKPRMTFPPPPYAWALDQNDEGRKDEGILGVGLNIWSKHAEVWYATTYGVYVCPTLRELTWGEEEAFQAP